MKRLNLILAITLPLLFASFSYADERHEISFPDLPGYKNPKMRTCTRTRFFSDGLVWPTIRVDEAWRQGFRRTCH